MWPFRKNNNNGYNLSLINNNGIYGPYTKSTKNHEVSIPYRHHLNAGPFANTLWFDIWLFRIRREEGEESADKQQNSIYNDSWRNYGKLLRHSQIVLGDVHVPFIYTACQIHPFHSFVIKKKNEAEDVVEEARLLIMYSYIHDACRPPISFNFNMMSSRL